MTRNRFDPLHFSVLEARQQLVADRCHDEVAPDSGSTSSTPPHLHYEPMSTKTIHGGSGEGHDCYYDTLVAFPDQRHEIIDIVPIRQPAGLTSSDLRKSGVVQ